MNRSVALLATFLFFLSPSFGQILERSLLSTAGSSVQNGSLILSYSFGEMISGTATAGALIATQGFQQTYDVDIGIAEIPEMQVTVFPNPTTGLIQFTWSEVSDLNFDLEVIDPLGRLVFNDRISADSPYQLNLSDNANGAYMIQLTTNGGTRSTFRVLKTD